MFDDPQLTFALDAVRRASHLVRRVQQEMVSPALTKADRSPVTVGDFAAQALVARRLAETFPDDLLVGEENAQALRQVEERATLEQVTHFVRAEVEQALPENVLDWIDRGAAEPNERFWTLDPIDGTKGFLRGEQYAVCLALIERGTVRLGVMGCPNLATNGQADVGGSGALFVAMRGKGCWVGPLSSHANHASDFVQVRVSDVHDPQHARLLRSVESGHTDAGKIDELAARLDIVAEPVRMDSQAKYCVLAGGGGDAIVRLLSPSRPDYREKIWDHAAGSIAVEEAGGRVTDLDGKPLDFGRGRSLAENRGILVTNGHLHEAILEALQAIQA